MKEYFDREALCAKLNERLTYLLKKNGPYDHYTDGYDEAVSTVEDFPAADVAPVVHGKPRIKTRTVQTTGYHEEMGVRAEDGATLYRKTMTHVDVPYEHCPECGATLCSRWHNYCGKCGVKMDNEEELNDHAILG